MEKHWPLKRASFACVHCFTGSRKELEKFVSKVFPIFLLLINHLFPQGYMIGITGFVCDKKRGEDLRTTLKAGVLPLDRLMIETDAPFMSPKNIPKVPRR
jgi:TatD DNase family protein